MNLERITVHEKNRKSRGSKSQRVDIYYDFVEPISITLV
ncbi:DUF4368 domain-containing protein [Clostridium aminobutyricum]|uniref:DUF4368 domain-containing protein n=1 Tax=Clostridium aminobutyricum TaxID=33953 RepID=A0A939IH17_CLOAM|nr:DUF4368 domain-containing protein [Clostridium aminobutyricum]